MTIAVRPMTQTDLEAAVEIERLAYSRGFELPGIGLCEALEPFAWNEHDCIAALRVQEQQTRVFVAVIAVSTVDETTGKEVQLDLVVGSLAYEIQENGFEIKRLSAHPADDHVRSAFVHFLVSLCRKSSRRRRISYHIADGDWENLRFFVNLGWDRRLVPNHFPYGDAWLVTVQVPAWVTAPGGPSV